MTDQPMDFREYLARQQQQAHMAQQFDALFTNDEDHAAAATQGVEDVAFQAAQEAAAVYDDLQESLTDVITQARDLRARITSGVVPERDAREILAGMRRQQALLVAKIAPTRSLHDSAQSDLKDPAAKREMLVDKYPALRR